MTFKVGDRVTMETKTGGLGGGLRTSPGTQRRSGEVRRVLSDDPHARYEIRWDRGHLSIYSPATGELRLERPQTPVEQA